THRPRCGRRPSGGCGSSVRSFGDLCDAAGAYGAAALTDGEPQTLVHGDRSDQLHRHLGVVSRHHHLGALGKSDRTGHIRGPEIELGPVTREERVVTTTLLLGEDV